MIDNSVMVLQNCSNLPEVVPGSYSETFLTSSHDENQVIDIKVEVAKDIEEEEDPLLITFPVTKAEHEVSWMSVYTRFTCVCTFHKYTWSLTYHAHSPVDSDVPHPPRLLCFIL